MSVSALFLGVGEACDHRHGNTAVLLSAPECRILCDCGFTVPHRLFAEMQDPEALHGVWISHFHGDHFFGVPLLLLRLWDMGRTGPLAILGQPGIREKVETVLELAYPGFGAKIGFPIEYIVTRSGHRTEFSGIGLTTAETVHGQCNQGVLFDFNGCSVYYSGDGRPTPEVRRLIRGADLVIHESFAISEAIHNHGSISGCLELAEESGAARFALTHLERNTRRNDMDRIREILRAYPQVTLPEEGETYYLP